MSSLNVFKGKKVFLTGHTGFKGAWMLQTLALLGAEVKGYSLAPEDDKDLFRQLDGNRLCYASVTGNILDSHLLQGELIRFEPDFVFHLAAQSLVRRSYETPVDTFSVNVMGTINVLEALRQLRKPCSGIMVTTDKVYENEETGRPFVEADKLGGHDPYSASKAAAEIAIASYRKSFFPPEKYATHGKAVAAVRAGNVIGGGDYAPDRIIPDIVRSLETEQEVVLRNPAAIRPWQHVVEPVVAYLRIAAKLSEQPEKFGTAFNIGPDATDVLSVEALTQKFIAYYGKGSYEIAPQTATQHEAKTLVLDNQKIKEALGWRPKYRVDDAIRLTARWYADKEQSAAEKTIEQITRYLKE